jgi:molybdenum cofactor sulfurtransferase
MSLDSLNASIAKAHVLNTTDPPQPTPASSFRANIIISQQHSSSSAPIPPYAEDDWKTIYINQNNYTVLGPCRRCHMVCIDQSTAEKRQEPFVTLAKTRKGQGGRVFFGVHLCLCGGKTGREKKKGVGGGDDDGGGGSGRSYLKIGDVVGV